MSCCPEGSWGDLLETCSDTYTAKGQVHRERDMDIYYVGEPKGGRCILWNFDIFGFNGGRTKMLCDIFAEQGFLVILADYYRDGVHLDPRNPTEPIAHFLKRHTDWKKLMVDFEDIVLPFARAKGAATFGSIGTCWGSYMVVRQSSYPSVRAGVSMHPSHTPISEVVGEEETQLLKSIQCPQLFMPAGNDHMNVKAGGLGAQVLGDQLQVVEFPDMAHGWTTRGDMKDDKVKCDVKKAVLTAIQFFQTHVIKKDGITVF